MKKVLISTFAFSPKSDGVSNVVYHHAVGLAEKGYKVTISTSPVTRRHLLNSLSEKGIQIVEFDIQRIRFRKYKGELQDFRNFLLSSCFDLIFSNGFPNWNSDLILGLRTKLKSKIVLISQGYSGNIFYSIKHIKSWIIWRPYTWNLLSVLRMADHLVFLSNIADKDRFYDLFLAHKYKLKYSVIPIGSDSLDIKIKNDDFKKKYNIETKYMILNVSGFSSLKNPLSSLKAFYKSNVKDTTLVICGLRKNNRKYIDVLKKFILNKKVKNVVLLENLSDEDIQKAYFSADLFICTSKTESFGVVVLDAICSGVPFISTLNIMKRFKGGIVVNNTKDLSNKISYLINNDLARAILINECTEEYLNNFRWSKIISQYESVIESTCRV